MNARDTDPNRLERLVMMLRHGTSVTLRVERTDHEAIHLNARYVIDPHTGSLIFSGPMLDRVAFDALAFFPDLRFDAAEILVRVDPMDPASDAACDRHQAYFGKEGGLAYWSMLLGAGKWEGWVVDEGGIALHHPWPRGESSLLRRLNADQSRLVSLCRRVLGRTVAEPTAVGADPGGVHVRCRGGVVRLAFADRVLDDSTALATIEAWLQESGT
ncbi:MAG: hypothetical protein KF866_08825 [Phycisphaeraceae bacterium]|nr:hypothetical protein [Phycisphaeraceae bacterium]